MPSYLILADDFSETPLKGGVLEAVRITCKRLNVRSVIISGTTATCTTSSVDRAWLLAVLETEEYDVNRVSFTTTEGLRVSIAVKMTADMGVALCPPRELGAIAYEMVNRCGPADLLIINGTSEAAVGETEVAGSVVKIVTTGRLGLPAYEDDIDVDENVLKTNFAILVTGPDSEKLFIVENKDCEVSAHELELNRLGKVII